MKSFKFKSIAKLLTILIVAIVVAKASICYVQNNSEPQSTTTDAAAVVITTSAKAEDITDMMFVPQTTLSEEESDDLKISYRSQSSHPRVDLDEDEIYKLASVVYLEARGESYTCQKAVASIIINRMCHYHKTLDEVLYEPDQFSTIDEIDSVEPDESCIRAARYVATCGQTIPWYVMYFRADTYHDWGDLIDYTQIDNTYFSYSAADRELV